MKVVKKINNNVAECIDNNGQELIAFGRGIGFPKTPYELTDLSKIDMTFYKLNAHFAQLLTELPEELIQLSVEIVNMAQTQLNGQLNPTLVFSLADHINFAIKRLSDFKEVKILFSHEVARSYPKETKVAEQALNLINEKLQVQLPNSEVTAVAMHFINGQAEYAASSEEVKLSELIEIITQIIEKELQVTINREEFNYQRFQTHVRYYLSRTEQQEHFIEGNQAILNSLKNGQPAIYRTATVVMDYLQSSYEIEGADDELLYLMIHINRLYEQNGEKYVR
ncbi:PRD domain-containing protein [Streptococcus merionis]|uniref:Beta-glucoside operon antiterminator n=1 Tax=Streptococcus merionis TaxID=400065 RepID=A0A239SNP4_9STRE|nr:PRD domain-containing protein [Streptococcus merionis]SNU87085.1 beta-glucoside operon antiterminator [Streptococcus merionis]